MELSEDDIRSLSGVELCSAYYQLIYEDRKPGLRNVIPECTLSL